MCLSNVQTKSREPGLYSREGGLRARLADAQGTTCKGLEHVPGKNVQYVCIADNGSQM